MLVNPMALAAGNGRFRPADHHFANCRGNSVRPDIECGLEHLVGFPGSIGLIVGLLVFSRRQFSRASQWLQQLDKNVFGIYVIHVFILVGIQQALVDLTLPASVKFSIAAVSGLLISYINVVLLRLIPWLRHII